MIFFYFFIFLNESGQGFFSGLLFFYPESTKQVVANYYILYFKYLMLSHKAQATLDHLIQGNQLQISLNLCLAC